MWCGEKEGEIREREKEGEREGQRERRRTSKVGKHGLILDAGATNQSKTDVGWVGRSGGSAIKLQNISWTGTHTHTHSFWKEVNNMFVSSLCGYLHASVFAKHVSQHVFDLLGCSHSTKHLLLSSYGLYIIPIDTVYGDTDIVVIISWNVSCIKPLHTNISEQTCS